MASHVKKSTLAIRQELIISDLKNYYDDNRNDLERINTFRQWEVTVFAAIIGFALSQGNLRLYLPLMIGIPIVFALLEILNRARMMYRHELARSDAEVVMNQDDQHLLEHYVFTSVRWHSTPQRAKAKYVFASLVAPQFLAWNISFTVLLAALWLTM